MTHTLPSITMSERPSCGGGLVQLVINGHVTGSFEVASGASEEEVRRQLSRAVDTHLASCERCRDTL